jgi:hypothetical protein
MRKFVLALLIVIVTLSILWIFAGRQISMFVDQFKMAEIESISIRSILYEGSGDGGTLVTDDHRLTLSPLNPHIGSTKENRLGLAHSGNVFAFGPLRSPDSLMADVENGDIAALTRQHSYLAWPNFSPARINWNRVEYNRLTWVKQSGAKLQMLWSVDPETKATSLIRIDISNPSR